MKNSFKLSIANYRIGMTIFGLAILFGIVSNSIYSFCLSRDLLDFHSSFDSVISIAIVLFPGLLLLVLSRTFSSREMLSIELDYIKSEKFGILDFSEIKSYKIQRFQLAESLLIKMNNGKVFAIGPRPNYSESTLIDYDNFKIEFVQKVNEINQKVEIIKEEKSNLNQIFLIVVIIIFFITMFLIATK